MAKYIIIQDLRSIAIPAQLAHILSEVKFVERKWSENYEKSHWEWETKRQHDVLLVDANQIKRPEPEPVPGGAGDPV